MFDSVMVLGVYTSEWCLARSNFEFAEEFTRDLVEDFTGDFDGE